MLRRTRTTTPSCRLERPPGRPGRLVAERVPLAILDHPLTERREADYARLAREHAILGLASVDKLPAEAEGPGFSRARLAGVRGAGVEIVLEVRDVDAVFEEVERAGFSVVEPLRERPWGLRDFRFVDPDGYYVR